MAEEKPTSSIIDDIDPVDLVGEEWAEWYAMSPLERLKESTKLWDTYLRLGGSLDPEPDTQSPFFDAQEFSSSASDGRPSVHIIRRSGV